MDLERKKDLTLMALQAIEDRITKEELLTAVDNINIRTRLQEYLEILNKEQQNADN